MAQRFLLSAAARTLSLATVLRMSDRDAEAAFAAIRWADTAGTRTFRNEDESLAFIKANLDKATALHADEAAAWNAPHGRYDMKRVNHQDCYLGEDGACTNNAESFYSRMRRAELGHHHHLSGPYLNRYAQEMAFREDHRRDDNGRQFRRVAQLVGANGPSVDFCGYWQRARVA